MSSKATKLFGQVRICTKTISYGTVSHFSVATSMVAMNTVILCLASYLGLMG